MVSKMHHHCHFEPPKAGEISFFHFNDRNEICRLNIFGERHPEQRDLTRPCGTSFGMTTNFFFENVSNYSNYFIQQLNNAIPLP